MFRRRRGRLEDELDAELRDHIDRQVSDYIAMGMPEAEARRRSRQEFGGAEQVKEDLREIHYSLWLNWLARDLRYTLRSLRKSPGFTAVALLVLALGIGSNLAVFSLIDSLFFQSLPVERPGELVQIASLDKGGRQGALMSSVLDSLRREPALRSVCGYIESRLPMDFADGIGTVATLAMTGDCFRTLGLRVQMGRPFDLAEDRRGAAGVALLTDAFWRRNYAGSSDVLGRTMQVKGATFTIIGVVDPRFTGFRLGSTSDAIIPLQQLPLNFVPAPNRPVYFWVNTIARRAQGVSDAQLQAKMSVIGRPLLEDNVPPGYSEAQRQDYLSRRFAVAAARHGVNSFLRARFGQPLYTVMGLCACVLLIASVNLTSLLLARGLGRQREMAVRLALGASRSSVARLFLLQSAVLVGSGAVGGFVFAQWARQVTIAAAGEFFHIAPELWLDAHTSLFLGAVLVLVTAALGFLPAWQATRLGGTDVRNSGGRGVVRAGTRKQKILLAFQVALTLALVTGSGRFTASARHLYGMSLGLRGSGVAEAMLAPVAGGYATLPTGAYHREMLEQIELLPGVSSAGLADFAPFWNGLHPDTVSGVEDTRLSGDMRAQCIAISERFFETLGMPLIAGVGFRRDDAEPVAIVSESVARLFGVSPPIGQHIRVGEGEAYQRLRIVGVVGNAQFSLENPDDVKPLTVYVNLWQHPERQRYPVVLVKSTTDVPVPPAALRRVVQSRGREYVEHYVTMESAKDDALIENRLLAWLSGAFGILALLLAATGLFGLLSYHVASRTGEIGIRMALGAERAGIHALVLRQVAWVMTAGAVGGIVLSMLTGRILSGLVYGVSVYDPRLPALSVTVMGVTALVAAWIPARRAAAVDPLVALRQE